MDVNFVQVPSFDCDRFVHGYQGVLFVFCVTQEDLQLGIHSLYIKTNSENALKKQLVVL